MERALTAFADAPDRPVAHVDLRTDGERAELAAEVERIAPADDPAFATTIPALFEAAAARAPEAPALACEGVGLTYDELDARTNRLARHLLALDAGVGPEATVALLLPRSERVVEALLAVQKAGAAYLPIDPELPADRVRELLADAGSVAVVSIEAVDVAGFAGPVVRLDDPATVAAVEARSADPVTDADRPAPLRPAHPAYVIYTSGSTGRPKGVVVPHRNVAALLANHRRRLFAPTERRLGRKLRIAHAWPFSFDASW